MVLRLVVARPPRQPTQVDLHWYLWPTASRGWDEGARQVRVTALATAGEEQALADARDFARLLFAQARGPREPLAGPLPEDSVASPMPPDALPVWEPVPAPVRPAPGPPEERLDLPLFR